MSIFKSVKQLLGGQRTAAVRVDSLELAVVKPAQVSQLISDWETTEGRLDQPQQACKLTFHNGGISGTCTGKIAELTGSAMVGLFEDLPAWLPSLLVRLTIQTDTGELIASLRESTGTIVSVSAPGTLECNTELTKGRVWLRCESGPMPVRNLSYEMVII